MPQSPNPPRRLEPQKPVLDPDGVCPLCRGAGFIIHDVPVSHPDYGRAVPCRCQEQARSNRRLRLLQRMSNLETVRSLTFDAFIAEPEHLAPEKRSNLRRAYDTARFFAIEPEGWLVFSGTYGCGKTHLAAAIANARIDMGEPVLFVVVPDLLDHLRATYSPQSDVTYDELFEQVRTTPLLILDDLGTQSSTPWAQEKLFQLLNYRYNAHLPTVITTNQRLEDLDPRLRSRLLDVSLVDHRRIMAPDYRAGKNPTQSDLSTLSLHLEQRFDTFDARRSDISPEERANLQEVFRTCQEYAEKPHGWLVLAGTYGCGKTHLAAAIANAQSEHAGEDVMLILVPDLLDHLRAAYSPQASTSYDRRFDEIKKIPMLVLDDLGTESATPWAREKLFQLLNYRYDALLPTVITTSFNVTTSSDGAAGFNVNTGFKAGKIEPWLQTRMFDVDRCRFCGIIAPGYRGSRSQQQARGQKRPAGRRKQS